MNDWNSFGIGIPTVNRSDLLNANLHKYFNKFPFIDIFILDNGKQDIITRPNNFFIEQTPSNYGVAKSWNKLCSQIFQNHTHALIINDDISFTHSPENVLSFLDSNTFDLALPPEEYQWSTFCLTKQCFLDIQFDENFYPAYYEDNDFKYQALQKNKTIIYSDHLIPSKFTKSGSRDLNTFDTLNKNRSYYIKKWGGLPNNETFPYPFNKCIS